MNLIVCERSSQFKTVLSVLKEIYPNDVFAAICTRSIGWFTPKFPDISFEDIPWCSSPSQSIYRAAIAGSVPSIQPWKPTSQTHGTLDETFHDFYGRAFKKILMFVDPDSVGVFSGTELLQKLSLQWNDILWCKSSTYSVDSIKKIITEPQLIPVETRTLWIAQRENKRLFDYWWLVNSMLVFGELKKNIGLKSAAIITKFELYTLCKIADSPDELTSDQLLSWMQNPNGSGRYTSNTARVGSSISYIEIIRSLIENHELVQKSYQRGNEQLKLTEHGRAFLALLHPKTLDPDLPFRVDSWLKSERPDLDKPVIERYIRQVFGRQLRYQRKCLATSR